MSNVFISYSHQNYDFAKKLYDKLTRDGVKCFFDKESILWGESWVVALEKGIKDSKYIVIVLTPAYFESEWAALEAINALIKDPAARKRTVRPLLLERCGDLPLFLNTIQYIDVSTPQKFEKNYPKICTELGGSVMEETPFADRSILPPVKNLPDLHRMPFRSLGNAFVGRISDLWQINDIVHESKTALVEGVGIVMGTSGIGKTQLAIEYVHRFGHNFSGGVFWVDADQGFSTMVAQVSRAADVSIDTDLKEQEQLMQLWSALNTSQPVLIVLDNFPEDESLQPWLPPEGNIHTLVTTRRRDLNYSRVCLDFMTVGEGIKVLNSGDRQFGSEAAELVKMLGGLPLALELTRNYMNLMPNLTVEALQKEIGKLGEIDALSIFARKYSDELPSGHNKEVAATFQMSWNLASSLAKGILQVMSHLAPAPVPRRLLRDILNVASDSILEDPLDGAISELRNKLSLVELDKQNDPWMHRLLSGFVRSTIEKDSPVDENVIQVVESRLARVENYKDTFELEKILPHAEWLSSSEYVAPGRAATISNLLLANSLKRGRFREAERHGRKALELSKQQYKPEDPAVSLVQSALAMALMILNELDEAKDLSTKALESLEKTFEPGHPKIAYAQSILAQILRELGQLEEARDLLRKVLESSERSFEPGNTRIALAQTSLAMVIKDLGQLDEAEDLLRKALKSYERTYEPGHPTIARTQSNLCTVLIRMGKLEEAMVLLQNCLECYEKIYDPGHLLVTFAQSNLARVLMKLGQLEEAKEVVSKAMTSGDDIYSARTPLVAMVQSNLTEVLQALGQLKDAKELARRAYESHMMRFGPEHPLTIIARRNLEAL